MAKTTLKKTEKAKERIYFTKKDNHIEIPSLIEHQNKSFSWLVQEGLGELLAGNVFAILLSPFLLFTFLKETFKKLDYLLPDG